MSVCSVFEQRRITAECDIGNGESMRIVPTPDEARANAHLIAAAPDLLAALKAILANDGSAGTYDLLKVSDAREAARAAIARAEGGAT